MKQRRKTNFWRNKALVYYLFNGGVITRESRFASFSHHPAYELFIGTAYRQLKMAPNGVSEDGFQKKSIGTSKCYQS